ncbi:MAG: hypothetical protein JWR69_2964 [Pedosphaera sp.]|nr:hypothetical protein [Pedosphaera sp.]
MAKYMINHGWNVRCQDNGTPACVWNSRKAFAFSQALLLLILGLLFVSPVNAANWYVDNAAGGTVHNGTSWASAWTSFGSVVWGASGVKAGDTLFISGGATSKTYTESWSVGASGTAASPIRIALDAANPAHNGTVIFDYNAQGDTATLNGIACLRSYVTFDGNVGGACHLVVANLRNILDRYAAIGLYADASTGVVIDHLASTNCNNPIRLASAKSFRVSHCNLRQVRGDAAITAAGSSGSWDANLIYSNVLEILWNQAVPAGKSTAYVGPDGIQCGSGVSIYGNTIVEAKTSLYTSDQHPDMMQATGNYLKVYANEFVNVGDSVFDYDCYGNANPHDVWIYNNLFRITTPIDGYPEFFRLYASFNAVSSISNFKLLNNTFADNNFQYRTIRFDTYGASPTASGIEIKNNLFYNCGGGSGSAPVIYVENSSGFTSSSFAFDGNLYYNASTTPYVNFRGTAYTAAAWVGANEPHGKTSPPKLVSYTLNAPGNNFHLQATDTVAKDAGLSMAAYFNTDKDGTARPQGTGWDIGAYEYGTGTISTNVAPVVAAITQNATDVDPALAGLQVYSGTTVQYAGLATDANGDALTWQWLYTVNGGAEVVVQSGSGVVAPLTYTYGAGTAGTTYLWKLRVSDGQTTGESQMIVGVEAPPVAGQGLTFEAEAGTITAPFVSISGYISQPAQTGVTTGGRAAYSFTLTNAGTYVIQAVVNAPNDGANSFYVNIDAEPLDPSMVWQIPITAGFESRLLNWQGSGTFDNPQFVPKSFSLSSGAHQLIIRGREAGTQLDKFAILKVPQAPQGLRIISAP